VLAEQSGHPQASEVFFTLQRLVLEGRYLSAAVARFPNTFTPMMVGLVRVGELTGG
jgi:type II secretory pathway component PulF